MTLTDFILHLLGFSLPALAMGVLLPLAARIGGRRKLQAPGYVAQAVVIFCAGWLVLAAGLALTGHDGGMATYGALVLAAGTAQWLLARGSGA